MSRVCDEFHLTVRQALVELAVPDLADFDAELVAEDSAALMFEIMELRAFAGAIRAFRDADVEGQEKLAAKDATCALVREVYYEASIAKVKART